MGPSIMGPSISTTVLSKIRNIEIITAYREIEHVMNNCPSKEGRDYKQGGMGKGGTGRYGKHHKKKKIALDGTHGEDGGRNTGFTRNGPESGGEAQKRQAVKELAGN